MRRHLINILFALAMIIMTLVLAISATLICAVKVLKPQHLTPIAAKVANDILDADVSLGRLELSFNPAFPILHVELDSLDVVSHAFADFDASERGILPVWADTLLTLRHFEGGVNVAKFLHKGAIALHHVEFDGIGANIVLARNGIGNFDIYSSSDTTAVDTQAKKKPMKLPPLSIDHFAFVNPRGIRYFNAVDGTAATIVLLRDMHLDDNGQPYYRLVIDGDVESPAAKQIINLNDIAFGLDGRVGWHPSTPALVTFDNFSVRGAFLKANLEAEVTLDTTLVVNKARFDLEPVAVADLLTVLPDSLRRANRLIAPFFSTDATVELHGELTKPFNMSEDTLPAAVARLIIPDCSVKYGKAVFKQFAADITADLAGGSLATARVDVDRLLVAGPATTLNITGRAWSLAQTPEFDVKALGNIDIANLPPILAQYLQGTARGIVDADITARGNTSMLSANDFHRLDVRGKIDGHKLYYLSDDTAKMADIGNLRIRFGTQVQRRRDTTATAPRMSAMIKVDTATILINGVDIAVGNLALNAGVENSRTPIDTTKVIPIGGALKVGNLNIISLSDSAGARIRDLKGRVDLHRYKGRSRRPEIIANLNLGRAAAGTVDTRLVISDAAVNASIHQLGLNKTARERNKEIRAIADSIYRSEPYLSPDSVLQLAIEHRRHHHGKKHVRETLNAADREILEFDLSKGFRKFLLGWQLNGTLTTHRARLFTPAFPLRNRISRLDIAFSNDSIDINNIKYRGGRSDLQLQGRVTNIRKALTASESNSLKANFRIVSDTIDVNQLADAAFTGAAYLEKLRKGEKAHDMGGDEDDLDKRLDAMVENKPDTTGPILIPTNIDAQLHLQADNILYSDFDITGMGGDILLYDGGVNLHRLRGNSDAGNLEISALYSAPKATDMHFGFSLDLEKFNIERFLALVPAIDSVMPLMRDFSGIIDAEVAATVDIDSTMNLKMPSLDAAVRLTGDSLAFINPKTYSTIGKWLLFHDRNDNKIKHINVEMIVRDNVLQIFPFSFDIDRYRLGVVGYNDLNMNFDYHIAVLKSPIPFKFGITVKGNPKHYKIRLGGAKFKEGQVARSIGVVDTARINLVQQIENVFRRGVTRSKFAKLNVASTADVVRDMNSPDVELTAADSAALIKEGFIEAPVIPNDSVISAPQSNKKLRKSRKTRSK